MKPRMTDRWATFFGLCIVTCALALVMGICSYLAGPKPTDTARAECEEIYETRIPEFGEPSKRDQIQACMDAQADLDRLRECAAKNDSQIDTDRCITEK